MILVEPRISVLVEPPRAKYRHVPAPELVYRLQQVLNPLADPNTDQRVMSWRQHYNNYRFLRAMEYARWKQALALVAQWKAEDMKARDYFSHYTPEGWGPWDLCRMAGVTPPGYVAECIGFGYREAPELLAAYHASASHRQVLEDDRFSHHGVGHAYVGQEPEIYWANYWIGGIDVAA